MEEKKRKYFCQTDGIGSYPERKMGYGSAQYWGFKNNCLNYEYFCLTFLIFFLPT